MGKTTEEIVKKRRGSATESLKRWILFFTPIRTIQILGFILVSFALFSWAGIWKGGAALLFLAVVYFLISFAVVKIRENKERFYFLNLAARDELTGLFVMRYVKTFLSKALNYSRTFRKPFAVILLDIDDFRKINEAYGDRTGDEVLKKTAEVIRNIVRTKSRAMTDVVGRYEKEEFIILLVGHNLATAAFGVAERIRKAIEQIRFQAGDKTFTVSVSAGVSVLKLGEKNAGGVVERAQEALLKAKAAGKNQTCLQND